MEDWDEKVGEAPGGEGEGVDFTGALEAAGDMEEELVGEAEEGHWDGIVRGQDFGGGLKEEVTLHVVIAKALRP